MRKPVGIQALSSNLRIALSTEIRSLTGRSRNFWPLWFQEQGQFGYVMAFSQEDCSECL